MATSPPEDADPANISSTEAPVSEAVSMSSSDAVPSVPATVATSVPSHVHEKLERRSSKSRLSKQCEVEEESADQLSAQKIDTSDVTTTRDVETDEDHSPNSDCSDQTVVPAGSTTYTSSTPHDSPKEDSSPDESENQEAQKMADMDKSSPTQAINPKVKLVRSQAVCDDASPPPEILVCGASLKEASIIGREIGITLVQAGNLSVSPTIQTKVSNRQKLGQDSSQGSSISDSGASPALSRDSSIDAPYTDATGTNLEEFIIKTLNKNRNDRAMLIHLETDMTAFIKDTSKEKHKFPQMSSYHRMLVHRVAAFFGLDHNVDESGKCVIVNRLQCTRLPDFKFADHIHEELPHTSDDQPKKSILKRHRDCTSLESLGTDRILLDDRKSKSFEEREEEYQEARNRIFQSRDTCVVQETPAETNANRPNVLCGSHRSSKEDVRWPTETRPWSSTDSSGYSTDGSSRLRVYVTKASSFHGVTVLTRGDSRTSTGSSASRFSKTDSTSSGISNLGSPIVIPPTIPSSPPLESQLSESESSGMSAASPLQAHIQTTGDGSGSPFLSFTNENGEPLAIWVASTIDQIPPGSVIINPQTGEPYVNQDGSIYRWYPPCEWEGGDDRHSTSSENFPETPVPAIIHLPQAPHQTGQSQQEMNEPVGQFANLSIKSPTDPVVSPGEMIGHPPAQPMYVVLPGGNTSKHQMAPVQQVYMTVSPQSLCPVASGQHMPSYIYQPMREHHDPGSSQACGGFISVSGSSYPPPSDVVQVMTFPQMTIQSVETYAPPPPPQQHQQLPPPGSFIQPTFIPHYNSEQACGQYQPQQPSYAAPAGPTAPVYYTIEGKQGNTNQVQVVGVNPATPSSPAGSIKVQYGGQLSFQGNPAGVSQAAGHYLYYTYPAGGVGQPVMPSNQAALPGQAQSAAPRCVVPLVRPPTVHISKIQGQPRRSPSPKSVQFPSPAAPCKTFDQHGRPPPSHSTVEGNLERLGGMESTMTRPHMPSYPRPTVLHQSQLAVRYRQPNIISTGEPRLAGPPMQHIVHSSLQHVLPRPRLVAVNINSGFQQQVGDQTTKSTRPHRTLLFRSSQEQDRGQQTSAETMETGDPSLSAILEVCGLPPTLRRSEIDSYLEDLGRWEARQFCVYDGLQTVGTCRDILGTGTVVAIFDSEAAAQRALASHSHPNYHLQPPTRLYSVDRFS